MQTKRKTMIVTGAAQGIVAGVTNAFIERGYNIVANSLNITASAFAATDRLAVVRGDSGDPLPAPRDRFYGNRDFGLDSSGTHLRTVAECRLFARHPGASGEN